MSGVFQIDRSIFEHEIWNNVAEFRIFFYLLGNAVWKEEGIKRGNVLVGRGQYLRSYRNIREDLMYMENNAIKHYSLSYIKKITDKLVKDGRLEKEETELGTLFTVLNYSKYQWSQGFRGGSRERSENGERTEREQNENNKNKDNKDNKDNNIITTTTGEPEKIFEPDSLVADVGADPAQQEQLVADVGADPAQQEQPVADIGADPIQQERSVARVDADSTKQVGSVSDIERYYNQLRGTNVCSSKEFTYMLEVHNKYQDIKFILGTMKLAARRNAEREGKLTISSFKYFLPILEDKWERKQAEKGVKTNATDTGDSKANNGFDKSQFLWNG